jgi:hypothetical protein
MNTIIIHPISMDKIIGGTSVDEPNLAQVQHHEPVQVWDTTLAWPSTASATELKDHGLESR